nr:magnesium transporter MRS2-1-like [Tanacetum cinerariifolium]
MTNLKERLLPPRPASASNLKDTSYRPSASGRQPFQGVDVPSLKKRGQGLRSWIRVDAATGDSQVIEVDKFTIIRRCDLSACDLCLLDPLFVYPSTILVREMAIVVNLEQIPCIITTDEVLLFHLTDGEDLYSSTINFWLHDFPSFVLEVLPNRNLLIYADLCGIENEALIVFRGTLRYEGFGGTTKLRPPTLVRLENEALIVFRGTLRYEGFGGTTKLRPPTLVQAAGRRTAGPGRGR